MERESRQLKSSLIPRLHQDPGRIIPEIHTLVHSGTSKLLCVLYCIAHIQRCVWLPAISLRIQQAQTESASISSLPSSTSSTFLSNNMLQTQGCFCMIPIARSSLQKAEGHELSRLGRQKERCSPSHRATGQPLNTTLLKAAPNKKTHWITAKRTPPSHPRLNHPTLGTPFCTGDSTPME